jgi:cytochrome c
MHLSLRLIAICLTVDTIAGSLPANAQDTQNGERIFRAQCAGCHSIVEGQNRVGPHLADIIGRRPGSVEGARYSPTLQNHDIEWNAETLDAYLADPRATVPGTTMTVGVPDAERRRDLIAYLETLGGE